MKNKIEYFLIDKKIRTAILVSKIKERIIYEEEGADVVEIIIATAVFAAAAIFVFNKVGGALKSKASDAVDIINDASF